jgi:thioredoxin
MSTVTLTHENFDEIVTGNDTVIIDFWAPWCGPCRGFAPVFESAAEKHQDIVFAKVNTDEQTELAQQFGIRSIPTLMVFREKVILYSNPGAMPAGPFDELIEQVKTVDMAKVHAEIAAEQKTGESAAS